MTYKESLCKDMKWLGERKDTVFIGQGIIKGDRMYGTLNDVPSNKCIEMPIAENLIMGVANGLALLGFRPVVIFQRMDFMLIAADQIINHTALIDEMSNGQFKCPVIIRACIGSQKESFCVGEQHRHNFKHVFSPYIKTLDYNINAYKNAYNNISPILIVEEKDLYETEVSK